MNMKSHTQIIYTQGQEEIRIFKNDSFIFIIAPIVKELLLLL